MRRYLSRKVVVDGTDRGLSLVEVDNQGRAKVVPFTAETHSTAFRDHPIVVEKGRIVSPAGL